MLGAKFKAIRKAKKMTLEDVANFISAKSTGHLSEIERDLKEPSPSLINNFKLSFSVNENWWKTGEGEMFNKEISTSDSTHDSEEFETCIKVDIYNMVDAGDGAVPEWHEPIDHRLIPSRYIKPGIKAVLVRGRSMEPTFKNKAVIGVNEHDKQVIEGEVYAVLLPYSGAVVKRLYPVPDGVIIKSDNKEFPEVKLNKADVPDNFILGRVCWVVQEV